MYEVIEHQHINVDLVSARDAQDLAGLGGKDGAYAITIHETTFEIIKNYSSDVGRPKVADQEGFMRPPGLAGSAQGRYPDN